MRKTLFLITMISSSVFAEYSDHQQGFFGPIYGLKSVESALNAGVLSDGTPVTLTGSLPASLGGSLYVFSDNSGNINVKIEYNKWRGLKVTPETEIVIQGHIDKTFTHTLINVDNIKLAKKSL